MKTVLAFLFLFCCCQWVSAQSVSLVTLGDSLTAGDGDDSERGGGFPTRVLALLQTGYPGSSLENFAVSGLTSDDLINIELNPAVNSLNAAPSGNRKLAFIWIGSNDLFGLYNWVCDDYFPIDYPRCEQEDIERYRNNLNTILSSLKATGAELYIALLDDQARRPVMTDASLRIAAYSAITAAEVARMAAQVTRYNEVIGSLAATYGAVTVDFYSGDLFSNSATLSGDGNHPNDTGYNLIAERWFNRVTGGSAPRPLSAGIEANGSDAPLALTAGNPLRIAVSLQSGGFAGSSADWWAVRYSQATGWAHFDLTGGWLSGLTVSYQGPLFDLPSFVILDAGDLPAGAYQFYFGVDTLINGRLDMRNSYYDSVTVTVATP